MIFFSVVTFLCFTATVTQHYLATCLFLVNLYLSELIILCRVFSLYSQLWLTDFADVTYPTESRSNKQSQR